MERQKHSQLMFGLLSAFLIAGVAVSAFAAPVNVTVAVAGDASPGATVNVKATIAITDGSTLLSVKWSQIGGVPVTLANTTSDTVSIALPNRRTFREELMLVLEEPPLADAQLPAHIPANPAYEGGLQNRFGVGSPHADGAKVNDLSLQSVKVVRPAGPAVELYALADPTLGKAGWNYFMAHSDKSKGVHNPSFVNSALDVSLFAVSSINSQATSPTKPVNAALGGGVGNGAGAVLCTSPYVYWSEIAGHTPGMAGSQWRTDLVARNLESSTASLRFILHQAGGNLESTGTIVGNSQKAFEDLTATMGGASNIGALEICSDRPLLVTSRIFNQGEHGTFGQNFDGRVANLGYTAGETISLIGLRQKTDAFRSNLVVTNGGKTDAEVVINLFDATGKSLNAYNLTVRAGTALQDIEPFKNRANAPDVDWGYATVTVLKGTNVLSAASMIDMKTNDPTTIPAKQ